MDVFVIVNGDGSQDMDRVVRRTVMGRVPLHLTFSEASRAMSQYDQARSPEIFKVHIEWEAVR